MRTATCRVAASSTYVALGVAALLHTPQTATAAFISLVIIQGMWMLNALADQRLSHRLTEPTHKHEQRMVMSDPDPIHGSDQPPMPVTTPPVAPLPDIPPTAPTDPLIHHVEPAATLGDVGDLDNRVTATETRVLRVGQDIVYVAAFTLLALLLALITGGFMLTTRSTIHELQAQQVASDIHHNQAEATQRNAVCVLVRDALSTYSTTARKTNPTGPQAYDAIFDGLKQQATANRCRP